MKVEDDCISSSRMQKQAWSHIRTKEGYITNPTEILQHHSGQWSKHWKADDDEAVREVQTSIAALIKEARRSGSTRSRYTAQEVRDAAKRFSNKNLDGLRQLELERDLVDA